LGQSIECLPAEERLHHYRDMAADTLRRAQESITADSKDAFVSMAARWSALAAEVERQMERDDKDVPVARGLRASFPRP
jgi:hypothetical protein